MSLHSAGLPGRVKRDPDGLRCRDSVLLGAAGNLFAGLGHARGNVGAVVFYS